MNLTEKIEKARTCVRFNPQRSGSGNCNINAYAPFDCDICNSYKSIYGGDENDTVKACVVPARLV